MEAGRRLCECLIVYCKIDVAQSIKGIKKKKDDGQEEEIEVKEYLQHNVKDIEKELTNNK